MNDTSHINWSNGIPANGNAELLTTLTARHSEHQEIIPRYTMLETRTGSPDGFDLISYKAGETYELPDLLASHFCRRGWAIRQCDAMEAGDE